MIKKGLILEDEIKDVPIILDLIPIRNKTSRPGIPMNPLYITIHNTGNSNKNANADMHTKYVDAASDYVSWHFTVDDNNIYQELPIKEVAWHAGDGNGDGNYKSIGIEICENADGDYSKAEENAIKLISFLMDELNINIAHIVPHKHWSGKYCPHVILNNGWDKFIDKIKLYRTHGDFYKQEKSELGYRKIRFKNHTDVHIYSTKKVPNVVLGKRYRQEYLTDIVKQYNNVACAVNGGMFAFDNKTEHYGLLVTDNGQDKKVKDYYQHSSPSFIDFVAWKDGTVSIQKKNGYDLEYLVKIQGNAHFGIGTSYALIRGGEKCTLNWDKFSHAYGHHNRTIIGYDYNNKVWYLIVADGRTSWDKGLTAEEEYELCKQLGITDACNLDGGGSSDMVLNGKVVTGNYRVSRKIGTAIIV